MIEPICLGKGHYGLKSAAKIVNFSERGGGMAQKIIEMGIKYDNYMRNGLWRKAKGALSMAIRQ